MKLDVIGRLHNTRLPLSKPLLPLFECIINSIHAIEEAGIKTGLIQILIDRDTQSGLIDFDDEEDLRPIQNISILDNGIGFNHANFSSFETGDTRHKILKGSKGIGRFIWLKAFEEVEIHSFYKGKDKQYFERKFEFKASEKGLENHYNEPVEDERRETTVTLKGYKGEFQKGCPRKIEDIALKIIEHCLVYFLYDCPAIVIRDPHNDKEIFINDKFKEVTKDSRTVRKFPIGTDSFVLNLIEVFAKTGTSKLHLCAHKRDVENDDLPKFIPNLAQRLIDSEGNEFIVRAYVSGDYLDSIVNQERTSLHFPKEKGISALIPEITEEVLVDKVCEIITEELGDYLNIVREEKLERFTKFITLDAPQYKPLLKYKPETIDRIKPTVSNKTLEIELFKIQQDLELEVKSEGRDIFDKIKSVEDLTEFGETYSKYSEKVTALGSAKLAQYIIYRKTILELLEHSLEIGDDDKYVLENAVHQVIFPLKKTSDDVPFDKQNLWIIDERLAYHRYLSSDKPFSEITPITSDSKDRADILIFNSPFAFVDTNRPPFQSVVIIEFKRPMRKGYSFDNDNPIEQVYGYIERIMEGKITDNKGRPIQISQNTPFYCYLICDLTPKIVSIAKKSGFTKTPDEQGFFGFNQNFNAYIEIIGFNKLLNDSKQRNQILFDKLQLPAQ